MSASNDPSHPADVSGGDPEADAPPLNPALRAKEAEEAAKAALEPEPAKEPAPKKKNKKQPADAAETPKDKESSAKAVATDTVVTSTAATDNEAADEEPEPESEPEPEPHYKKRRIDLPKSTRTKQWGMNPEDRLRVMEACLLVQRSGWRTHFSLMMFFSATVALMGLSANSAAVVIGAMLMAPLMTPVLGIAASIAMVIGPALVRSLVTVILATLGVIVWGIIVGGILPTGLSPEVLARTAPDIRDLIVAIAAGLAGSYATARPDVSSSLPGVAIAVALVPPLAVVGLTIEAGRWDLASGALLLYVTNLAAIVFSSTIMFVATGFVPGRRLAATTPRVALGAIAALAIMVAVTVPLALASLNTSRSAQQRVDVEEALAAWLINTGDEIEDLDIDANRISVAVRGTQPPPATDALEENLSSILEQPVELDVVWTAQVQPGVEGSRDLTPTQVQVVVEQWLNAADGEFAISTLELDGNQLQLNLESAQSPPGAGDLSNRLVAAYGISPEISLNWTQLDNSAAERQLLLTTAAETWAADNDVDLAGVSFDGLTAEVDLRGEEPPDATELQSILEELAGDEAQVNIRFTYQVPLIGGAAPTPTPAPTPVPTPVPPTPVPTPAFDFVLPTPVPGG